MNFSRTTKQTSAIKEIMEGVDQIIEGNRCVFFREISDIVEISVRSVETIIHQELQY